MSAPPVNALQGAIQKLAFREPLTADEAQAAFDIVMQGQATAVQVAALLASLRATGESPEVVAGVVRALRSAMVSLSADDPDDLVDTCGTGGGAVSTFNISTAAAIVAAGAGVRIAKHGNRSFTSRCGSADVLEALGVPIEVPVAVMEASLRDAGIVFMFAPAHAPGDAARRCRPPRAGHSDGDEHCRSAREPGPGRTPGRRSCRIASALQSSPALLRRWGPSTRWSFTASRAWTKSRRSGRPT